MRELESFADDVETDAIVGWRRWFPVDAAPGDTDDDTRLAAVDEE